MPDNTRIPPLHQNTIVPNDEPFTVNEIIGRPPGWILRSGMTILFIVVAIGLAMTFVIRYPDKIQAAGVITTIDPFKPIIAGTTGVVDTVFVHHQDLVEVNTPLFYIENTAERKDVQECIKQIDKLEQSLASILPHNSTSFNVNNIKQEDLRISHEFIPPILGGWKELLILGPLQSSFASLTSQVRELNQFLHRKDHILKLTAINREIEEIRQLNKVLEQEKELTGDEVNLSKKDVKRNQQLYDHGIISEREMERSQAGHLGVRKIYLLKGSTMAQNRIRIATLDQQITEILANRREQFLLYQSRITEIVLNIRNQYRQWHRQYFIEAPAYGRVQLSSDLVAGQSIPAGKPIGYLIPESVSRYDGQVRSNHKYGKVYLPATGIGKIQTGDRAIIRLEAYPYKQYGTIDAQVDEIYPIAEVQDNGLSTYEIHLPLDSVLRTDYGYPIHYTPDMPVQVNIIADERSLFSRIFEQILNLINQHSTLQVPNITATLSEQDSVALEPIHGSWYAPYFVAASYRQCRRVKSKWSFYLLNCRTSPCSLSQLGRETLLRDQTGTGTSGCVYKSTGGIFGIDCNTNSFCSHQFGPNHCIKFDDQVLHYDNQSIS